MTAEAVAVVMSLIFLWGVVSARLDRADLSAPIVFVIPGLPLSRAFNLSAGGVGDPAAVQESTKLLAEVTLVWVLFADASRVGLRELRTGHRHDGAAQCLRPWPERKTPRHPVWPERHLRMTPNFA